MLAVSQCTVSVCCVIRAVYWVLYMSLCVSHTINQYVSGPGTTITNSFLEAKSVFVDDTTASSDRLRRSLNVRVIAQFVNRPFSPTCPCYPVFTTKLSHSTRDPGLALLPHSTWDPGLALLPHSARDPGSIPGWVTVCLEFTHSPRVCVGFLRVLRFPPTVQRCAG